jgi:hypothetical protein
LKLFKKYREEYDSSENFEGYSKKRKKKIISACLNAMHCANYYMNQHRLRENRELYSNPFETDKLGRSIHGYENKNNECSFSISIPKCYDDY